MSLINKRLPGQVRRNMGKDGRLHNRTGRFSNSAQLLNEASFFIPKFYVIWAMNC